MDLQKPFDMMTARWERAPALIQYLTFPIVFPLAMLPAIFTFLIVLPVKIALMKLEPPPDLTKVSRGQLAEVVHEVIAELDHDRLGNPDIGSVLDTPLESAKSLANILNDSSQSISDIDEAAKLIIAETTGTRFTVCKLTSLAKRIEEWVAQNMAKTQQ